MPPHEACLGGIVVGDEHERSPCLAASGHPSHDVRTLAGRDHVPQPLAASGLIGVERDQRREREQAAPGESRQEVKDRARRPRRLVSEWLDVDIDCSDLPQPIRHPARRAALSLRSRAPRRQRAERLDVGSQAQCQSIGPAVRTCAESGRPRTSCTAREHSSSLPRSIPVSKPISWSIETRSSVATLPVAPAGTGQPPSSPNEDSNERTPTSTAASALASPCPRVLWKWAVSSTPSRGAAAAVKKSRTCIGLAMPVVSPNATSSQPAAARRPAIAKTRSGGTCPS